MRPVGTRILMPYLPYPYRAFERISPPLTVPRGILILSKPSEASTFDAMSSLRPRTRLRAEQRFASRLVKLSRKQRPAES